MVQQKKKKNTLKLIHGLKKTEGRLAGGQLGVPPAAETLCPQAPPSPCRLCEGWWENVGWWTCFGRACLQICSVKFVPWLLLWGLMFVFPIAPQPVKSEKQIHVVAGAHFKSEVNVFTSGTCCRGLRPPPAHSSVNCPASVCAWSCLPCECKCGVLHTGTHRAPWQPTGRAWSVGLQRTGPWG